MKIKHVLIYGATIVSIGGLTFFSLTKHNNPTVTISTEEINNTTLNFNNKTATDMRAYYTEEGLEFIKKILPDSISSDLALLNVGKRLTEELKDIKFTTADNKTIELQKLQGKKIILDFALTSCNVCQSEIQFLSTYNFEKEDIVFLHVFPRESTAEVKSMIKNSNGKFHSNSIVSSSGVNGLTFEDLNITNVPAKIFIDEKGVVQYAFVGGITDEETLQLHLERAFDNEIPKMLDYLK